MYWYWFDSKETSTSKSDQKGPYPKRDVVKFGFHGKLEAGGRNFLAEFYITEFHSIFFMVVYTVLR